MKKIITEHLIMFAVIVVMAIVLLFAVSLIPQSWLTKNLHEGRDAYYSKSYPLFRLTEQDNYSTYIDNGTDQLMMELTYMLGDESSNIINPLVFSPEMDKDVRYGRYWHGYAVFMRPLMIFFSQADIIKFLAGLTILLAVVLSVLLIYKKQYVCVIAMAAASYMAYFEIILKCTEYIFCLIVALALSIYICSVKEITDNKRYLFYFFAGAAVAYFDFLTFETLALAMPMMIDIAVHRNVEKKSLFFSAVDWCIGYGLMFAVKFILLYFASTHDDMGYSVDKLIDKFNVDGYSIFSGIMPNIELLRFPSKMSAWIFLWVLCISVIYIVGWEHKENIYLLAISFIPFIRFMCLSGHSVTHCVFTYHALFISIMAMTWIILSPLTYFVFDKKSNVRTKKGRLS